MFSIEEISLMKMYSGLTPNRLTILSNLKAVLPHFTGQEEEIKDLTNTVVRKLTAMNDKAFSSIDFSMALDEEAPEENESI